MGWVAPENAAQVHRPIGSDVARPLLCPMDAPMGGTQPRQQLAVDHGFEQHHAVAFERRHRMRAGHAVVYGRNATRRPGVLRAALPRSDQRCGQIGGQR